jgi:hypothetical protein
LGGVAGSEGLRVLSTASAARYVQVEGSVSGQPRIQAAGASTTLALSGNGANGLSFWSNSFATQQFAVSHTASAVNYVQVTGAATGGRLAISSQGSDSNINLGIFGKGTGAVYMQNGSGTSSEFLTTGNANYLSHNGSGAGTQPFISVKGSDTNVALALRTQGTGAIDLAAGSSGVNISNGGTVTAITQTNSGSGYTSLPTPAISAPTTAGGVQATISITMSHLSASTISNGGTGYTVGNVLTIVGGTAGTAAQFTVTSVSGGVVTGITRTGVSTYTVLPSSPSATTGGTGTGCTIAVNWSVNTFTITNAGSGYVEQPTVTFSGGGGSGAAAYATVGGTTTVRGLGSALNFAMPGGGTSFRIADNSTSNDYFAVRGSAAGNPEFYAEGSSAAISVQFLTKSTSPFRFFTRGTSYLEQFRISDTASAVNYVQVTGAATGGRPTLSAQGSDSNISFALQSKGSFGFAFLNSSGGIVSAIAHGGTSTPNYVQQNAAQSGTAPVLTAAGSDTNIDLALTPKGTGNVRFGTYTANMALVVQGYIEIKDSGGTVRKLAVIA